MNKPKKEDTVNNDKHRMDVTLLIDTALCKITHGLTRTQQLAVPRAEEQ